MSLRDERGLDMSIYTNISYRYDAKHHGHKVICFEKFVQNKKTTALYVPAVMIRNLGAVSLQLEATLSFSIS